MTYIFWIPLVILFHSYIGYMIILFLLSKFSVKNSRLQTDGNTEANLPSLSLIIAAYNEEKIIETKIKNCLSLNYPMELLEIIIISDGSIDKTQEIIESYSMKFSHLKFIKIPERRGKTHALNTGVSESTAKILVFSDANVIYDKNALKSLVTNFNDPEVGGASGKVLIYSSSKREILGEGLYMKYERQLQKYESDIRTIIGTDGAMYAIRRELFRPVPVEAIIDDFIIALQIVGQNYRFIYEENAVGYEETAPSVENEFKRKVRIFAGGFQSLKYIKNILNPMRQPFAFFQFISHKFLRWTSPLFMIALFGSNMFLIKNAFYDKTFMLQILFYSLALIGYRFPVTRKKSVFYFPLYFSITNIAALLGLFRHFSGRQKVTWERGRN